MGWVAFAIALIVFTLTVEPSVPLWDCGEFISASFGLQVVHPPGAPLFLLLGRFFSLFTSDVSQVAFAVNMLSVVASALTVALTFWIITHLALKTLSLNLREPEISMEQSVAVYGAAMVGALALTFMDTFWFSAVEAEVYAISSLFTALSFWGVLKWETAKNDPRSGRWLIFIAYTIGLAIGLHLLNLLVIPAVVLYYFLNRYPVNTKNIIRALLVGGGALIFLNFIFIPGLPKIGAYIDLMFVNSLGLPFNSGLLFTLLLVGFGVFWGIRYSIRHNKPILNLALLCFGFIMIGYSSYTTVVIRSLANPPIDMNNPEDAYSLLSYINREQYGQRALFKGPYYNARPIALDEGAMNYRKGEEKYEPTTAKFSYEWNEKDQTILPRMGDLSDKKSGYRLWYKERKKGENEIVTPTFQDNLSFMFSYQLNWMYWRYFFWNFAGRQSDNQSVDANPFDGNWMSGIPIIDDARLGTQKDIPISLSNNLARNKYYMLPFLLGLLGLFFQYKRQQNDALVITVLFIFTGIMIVIYLNQPPLEPRERDYSHVGSFQTFCIWIGLGVLQLYAWMRKKLPGMVAAGLAVLIGLAGAPIIMADQNWDDHDRSDRYLGISFAENYLNSCAQNAILFTNGDNDTYPLWYAQNVEGIRTDVRIINLSLLSTEWYAQALTRKYYSSEPLPMSIIPSERLKDGQRESFSHYEENGIYKKDQTYFLSDVLQFMTSDRQSDKARTQGGDWENYLPTRKVAVKVDRNAAISSGMIAASDSARIVDMMQFTLPRSLYKGSLVMLDIIATNAERGWERPIYFTTTTSDDTYMDLEKYFRHEGLTYRLVPIQSNWSATRGMIDNDLIYKRLMTEFVWGNMDKGTMFLDSKASLVPRNLRVLFAQTARNYLNPAVNDKVKAKAMIDKCQVVIPESILPMEASLKNYFIDLYIEIGDNETATKMLEEVAVVLDEESKYYLSMLKDTDINIRRAAQVKLVGYDGKGTNAMVKDLFEASDSAKRLKNEKIQKQMEGILNLLQNLITR